MTLRKLRELIERDLDRQRNVRLQHRQIAFLADYLARNISAAVRKEKELPGR